MGAVWRARQNQILGAGPRILPMDRNAVAEQVQATTSKVRGSVVGDAARLPIDVIPEVMFTMCRHPDLWDRVLALSIQMQSATGLLAARDRQLAILRTAWLLQAPYEWGEHVKNSKRIGISAEEIEAVIVGSTAGGWCDHDRAVLQAAEELRGDALVSEATWQRLAQDFEEPQLIELLILIGHFTNLAYLQNSLGLRLEAGNEGLEAR